MQKAAPTQRSSYLTALSQEIERKLQKALNSPSQRLQLLQQLFADIALEVDERARGIIVGGGEDKISKAKEDAECRLCFYDVLAEHFVIKPENGKRILDLIVLLWSQSFASHIFSLLFHKWLFEVPVEKPEALLRYGSALVQGATNVFWKVIGNVKGYLGLYLLEDRYPNEYEEFFIFVLRKYLLEDVALFPSHLEKISSQARRDLFHLLSRFLFFYNFDHTLKDFLKHFPISSNAFLVGGPGDIFVIELTDQLQKLKVEPVLLHYLTCLRALQGLELRMTTSTRLKVCLYSFTSPGGPMYPTRAVRHAAWDALDLLFPVGQYPRHIISLFFRLLYPWYWPSSCWNFIKTCITTILQSLLGLIFSSWQRMKNSKVD